MNINDLKMAGSTFVGGGGGIGGGGGGGEAREPDIMSSGHLVIVSLSHRVIESTYHHLNM